MTILDSFKTESFLQAYDNPKSDENGRKSLKREEKSTSNSPFPTVFSKDLYCRDVKTKDCLDEG